MASKAKTIGIGRKDRMAKHVAPYSWMSLSMRCVFVLSVKKD